MDPSLVKEFADLSEQELDRIETLVQNLLKITKLDAGSIMIEKETENVADMMGTLSCILHTGPDRSRKKSFCPAQIR